MLKCSRCDMLLAPGSLHCPRCGIVPLMEAVRQSRAQPVKQSNGTLLAKSFAIGFGMAVCLNVPFAGALVALAGFPVFLVFPEFSEAGRDVGYTFATLYLKSAKAWLAFTAFFSFIAAVAAYIFRPSDEAPPSVTEP